MNINAIKRVCAGGKRATIYRAMYGGGQWISNGFAAYRVKGVVIESPEALMELWNLKRKVRDAAIIDEQITSDRRFRPFVEEGKEEELSLLGMVGLNETAQYVGLWSKDKVGVLWIDVEWLKPLRMDYARYFARWEFGRALVAVHENLTGAEALILPVHDMIANTLMSKAAQMSAAPYRATDTAADAEAQAEALIRNMEGGAGDDPTDADGDVT